MATRVLIVEDEPAIAEPLVYALRTNGFEPRHVTWAREGLAIVHAGEADFAVLDVGLPDMSGFDLCKAIRTISDVPVLFLTARSDEIDKVVGLEIGADDYVAKPFSPREVVARIRTILKRGRSAGAPTSRRFVERAEEKNSHPRWFAVDEGRARISFLGATLELTKSEFLILKGMIAQPERVLSRAQIMALSSDSPGASLERTVDAHIKSLRAKLRAVSGDLDPIETHRGLGYSIRNERTAVEKR